jgi:5-methyltetrahydropteroyltriglutamate--homocysteine methyltransferase
MDYAAAVNEEIRDLFSAGADVVQIDEPYMQARPEEARAFGLRALNRALENISGVTAVHICFGYAAIIHVRPSGYSFLPELAECSCARVSIETAQSNLDCAVLRDCRANRCPSASSTSPSTRSDARAGSEPHPARAAIR